MQKSNQSGLVKTNASLSYLQKEREVIHKAEQTWINLVGTNKQLTLIDHRLKLAEEGEISSGSRYGLSSHLFLVGQRTYGFPGRNRFLRIVDFQVQITAERRHQVFLQTTQATLNRAPTLSVGQKPGF